MEVFLPNVGLILSVLVGLASLIIILKLLIGPVYARLDRLDHIEDQVNNHIPTQIRGINQRLDQINQRFDKMQERTDQKLDQINQRFDKMQERTDQKLDKINQKFDKLQDQTNQRFDQINQRLDVIYKVLMENKKA